ncbi:MAG: TIGR01777 family oxidoreductase [Planctomycetaceae bacterium]|nr:TIGR01777 family oxidoreductase [Planctomycetaceae bacterium]
MSRFVKRSLLPVDAATAFAWHERPGALARLTPPWERVEVVKAPIGIAPGTRVELRMQIGPIAKRWVAEHTRYVPGSEFQDVQVSGPFAKFEHTHRILPRDATSSWLEDEIDYALPGGWLGQSLGGAYVREQLQRMFRYRHATTAADLTAHQRESTTMKILVTGASGLVGTSLSAFLTTGGHEVLRLTRSAPRDANDISWNPESGTIDPVRLDGLDAVVHLAGENIAGARWSAAVKQRIRDSRVKGTRMLCEALARLARPPKTLICASAIGFYGNRGEEVLREGSPAGTGYLADVCREWEEACAPARSAGIRVVNLRIGVVLSAKGGALQKMLFPFKMGGGGVIGSGKQYWSWVAIDDVVGAIHHCLQHEEISGPVNATAPQPSTNLEFTKILGKVLHRPTVIPMPGFAARIALGEMATDLLLSSARVVPETLERSGYQFRCPSLEGALRHELGL